MSKDSVKFLNEKRLLTASYVIRQDIARQIESDGELKAWSEAVLGRMLGEKICEGRALVTCEIDAERGEWVFKAEVYALSPADMHKLYGMIRDEIRREFS